MRIVLLLLFLFCALQLACALPPMRTVVLVTMSGVSLDELTQFNPPELQYLYEHGALGLLNCNTADVKSLENIAATISAGACALGQSGTRKRLYPVARFGHQADELVGGMPARVYLEHATGTAIPQSAVVQTGFAGLCWLNSDLSSLVIPGLLGEELKQAGVRVAVYGNSDQHGVLSRCAVTMAMDEHGVVADGDVSQRTLLPEKTFPYGVHTNYRYILQHIASLSGERNFIVIEAGDGARLSAARGLFTPEQYLALQKRITGESLQFLRDIDVLLQGKGANYLLCLAVLRPSSRAWSQGEQLTPLFLLGTDIQRGVVTSATTRRAGIVTITDISATILTAFGRKIPDTMLGQPMVIHPMTASDSYLLHLNRQIVAVSTARPFLMYAFLFLQGCAILCCLGAILYYQLGGKRQHKLSFTRLLQLALISFLLLPFAFLLAPALHCHSLLAITLLAISFSVGASYLLLCFFTDTLAIFSIIGLLTSIYICIDLLAGAPLMKQSVLGYDAMVGVRFYGLGNEYSGIIISAALLGSFSWLQLHQGKSWKLLVLPSGFCLLIFLLIGHPHFGSDFGGMLCALPAFTYAFLSVGFWKMTRLRVAIVCSGVCGIFLLVLALNIFVQPDDQTHIGRVFNQALQHGSGILGQYAWRKWAMNIHLLLVSRWALSLAFSLIGLLGVAIWPSGILQKVLAPYPRLTAGLNAILLGMLLALVTNDSGVAMAATGLPFLVIPVLLLVLERVGENKELEGRR